MNDDVRRQPPVRVRSARLLLALAFASTALLAAPVARIVAPSTANAAGTFSDPHFREDAIFTGLVNPTTVRFAADGRAFVAEKRGIVKAYDSIDDTTPTTVVDLRTAVDDFWDRGLLDMALDPDFLAAGQAARPYLYLYYVYDAPPGGTAPTWNDTCPNPPESTTDGCVVTAKLVRLTIDRATNVAVAGSTVELVHDWCAQFPSHSGGAMAFGDDGYLYVAGGDGASFNVNDYGQRGGTLPNPANPVTPINPCGDPVTVTSPAGVTPVVDATTSEGGSLRSQDLRTPGDPVGLAGALIRIDPDTGVAAPDNPLAASADDNARRVVAYGLRNPYRLTKEPASGDLYIGDVGNSRWEEVDRFVPPSGQGATVRNYGWPCYEGSATSVGWDTMGNDVCDGLYADGPSAVTGPVYTYSHTGTQYPCGASSPSNSSIAGLAFYEAADADEVAYPARYDGALFFVDYSRNCLAMLRPGAGGVPDPATAETIASGLGHPVDLVTGPHGDLYYADFDGGRIVRIRYAPSPVAHATVTPAVAVAPVTVTLDASGSLDPDPEASLVSWEWDLDHDGTFDGPSDKSGQVVQWPIAQEGVFPITLRVTSSNGFSDTAELSVDTTDTPPVPHIATPSGSLAWSVGDEITFGGSATDAEDGDLAPTALDWSVILMHCVGASCHEHLLGTYMGVAGGDFTAPDHEYPSHLELRLTATDSHGSSATTSLDLQPATTSLQVRSAPTGVPITVGGTSAATPSDTTLIRGGTTSISAPAVWTHGTSRYRFGAWDDGLARTHDVTITDPSSRTATYVGDAPDVCASATTVTPGAWVADRASGDGDADWFRFTLAGRRRVVVTLGDLPVDARLELYGTCSTLLGTSDVAGTRFERLTRSLPGGTYRVRVRVPSGARSLTPYALQVLVVDHRVAIASRTVRWSAGITRVVGDVINGTGAAVGRVAVTATLKDEQGRVVGTLHGSTFANRLADGATSSFVLSGSVPAYVTVTYQLKAGTPGPSRSLSLRSLSQVAGPAGTITETGRVRNDGRLSASSVEAARTWYGRRGEVLDARTAAVVPATLAHGADGTFRVVRPSLTTVQAAVTALRAR